MLEYLFTFLLVTDSIQSHGSFLSAFISFANSELSSSDDLFLVRGNALQCSPSLIAVTLSFISLVGIVYFDFHELTS